MNPDNKNIAVGLIIVALIVLAALFVKKDHLDNPLVFLVFVTVFVTAGQKVGQWIGVKCSAPGVASFFGSAS